MIPLETVNQTWIRISQMSFQEIGELIVQFRDAQPAVGAYLIDLEGRPFDEEEIELLLYTSMVLWEILRQSERPPGRVGRELLEEAEDAQMDFLLLLVGDTPADFFSAIKSSLDRHPELDMLRSVVHALNQQQGLPDDEPMRLREGNSKFALIHLMVVLDALLASRA